MISYSYHAPSTTGLAAARIQIRDALCWRHSAMEVDDRSAHCFVASLRIYTYYDSAYIVSSTPSRTESGRAIFLKKGRRFLLRSRSSCPSENNSKRKRGAPFRHMPRPGFIVAASSLAPRGNPHPNRLTQPSHASVPIGMYSYSRGTEDAMFISGNVQPTYPGAYVLWR